MLARLVLPALLLATNPLSRGCNEDEVAETPEEAAAAPDREVEPSAPTPAPSPRARFALADLAPRPEPGSLLAATHAAEALLAGGDPARALAVLDAGGARTGPAADTAMWARATALRGLGRDADAALELAAIPPGSRFAPEALLERADIALRQGDPKGALALLGSPAPGPPYDGTAARADVLRARAHDRGGDLSAAITAARRVWRDAPATQADADATVILDALELRVPEAQRRGLPDRVARAAALASRSANKSIVTLLEADEGALRALGTDAGEVACQGLFQMGRALHKQREYDRSVPLLETAAQWCTDDEGAKSIYLLAQGRARQGDVPGSILTFLRLPDEHPTHTYADDGLFQASRMALDDGRFDEARRHAERLLDAFPDGDMGGATLWTLASSAMDAGDRKGASRWLARLAEGDVHGAERPDVLRGRYWQARLRLDADGADGEAIAALEALATLAPLDWYGVLAFWRLAMASPSRADVVAADLTRLADALRAAPLERPELTPLREFTEQAPVQAALALLRSNLLDDARLELRRALGPDPVGRWTDPETLLFASHLFELTGDMHGSHDLLRRALRQRTPTLDASTVALWKHGWPRAFADVIDRRAGGFSWDHLLFQGLVREESAFNPGVTSWAGANGLSQLMWPTAKETANRIGLRGLQRADLVVPDTNVHLGATYFDGLATRWKGHLPLAVASYNAGPGAVAKWVDARGDQPLDAFVEAIPYDETRGYVCRVVSSWQAYQFLYGAGTPVIPLRIGPVAASLSVADPQLAGGLSTPGMSAD